MQRALLGLSVAVNILLSLQVHHLKQPTTPAAPGLQIGQVVPPIAATDRNNRSVIVPYDDTPIPTILYVLRPNCSWCTRNLANFHELTRQTHGRYRVVALSLTSAGNYAQYGGEDSVLTVSEGSRRALRLGATPQTLVVSRDGRMLHNWVGAYTNSVADIETSLRISLPGLLQGPDAGTSASFR